MEPALKRSPAIEDALSVDWAARLAECEAWLRKVILARTGEKQAVDEVYQQVACEALRHTTRPASPSSAGPWLHRLAVVHSARYLRRLGRTRRAMKNAALRRTQEGTGQSCDVLSLLLVREREELVRQALAKLPPADAEVLALKYGERWSCREMARRLGITEKAVECRLARARARLRNLLADFLISDP